MGRSNGENGNSNGAGGNGGGTPTNKIVAGVAAIVIALVCSVFGISTTSGNSASSNSAQVTASQTSSSSESSASSASNSSESSSAASSSSAADAGTTSEATSNLTFRNEERLQEHYEKHGIDMGFSSAEAYVAGANKVISNPDALHKTESKDGDDAYYLEDTGEFVVVSQKGYIRTYFLASKDYYERQ